MTPQAMARPYATALFEVVSAEARSRASAALSGLADVLASSGELRGVLESPAVPAEKKRGVVEALCQAAGDVPIEVRRIALLLAGEHHIDLLPHVAAAFAARVRQVQNVVEAEVVTAVPLDDAGRARLAAALGRAIGGQVTIRDRVDPSIVGGIVAKVGSTVFDGSVTRQLERLRQKLLVEA